MNTNPEDMEKALRRLWFAANELSIAAENVLTDDPTSRLCLKNALGDAARYIKQAIEVILPPTPIDEPMALLEEHDPPEMARAVLMLDHSSSAVGVQRRSALDLIAKTG